MAKTNIKEPEEISISVSNICKFFVSKSPEKLRFTDVSLYSTTPADQAEYITDLLLSYYNINILKTKILTDIGACIGGNTCAFAKRVKHVNAVEISKLHSDILSNNANILEIKNIEIFNNNYSNIKHLIKQNILFLDPPWGGVNYNKCDKIHVAYQGFDICTIINDLLYGLEIALIKLPNNVEKKLIDELKNTNFRSCEEVLINDLNEKPIYKIMILSNLPKLREFPMAQFPRLGYKKIKIVIV